MKNKPNGEEFKKKYHGKKKKREGFKKYAGEGG